MNGQNIYVKLINMNVKTPFLKQDLYTNSYSLIYNSKVNYRRIKRLMKEVKKRLELENGKIKVNFLAL